MKESLDSTRRELGVDRKALAALLEISPKQLLEIERGHSPPPANLAARLEDLRTKRPLLAKLGAPALAHRTFDLSARRPLWPLWVALGGLLVARRVAPPSTALDWVLSLIGGALAIYVFSTTRKLGPFCSACRARVAFRARSCKSCGAELEKEDRFIHAPLR